MGVIEFDNSVGIFFLRLLPKRKIFTAFLTRYCQSFLVIQFFIFNHEKNLILILVMMKLSVEMRIPLVRSETDKSKQIKQPLSVC